MNSENKHKKKNKMERGLTNRHVQVMAIAGTIGTGLFLGAGRSISLTGPSIGLYDYGWLYVSYDACYRGNVVPRSGATYLYQLYYPLSRSGLGLLLSLVLLALSSLYRYG